MCLPFLSIYILYTNLSIHEHCHCTIDKVNPKCQ